MCPRGRKTAAATPCLQGRSVPQHTDRRRPSALRCSRTTEGTSCTRTPPSTTSCCCTSLEGNRTGPSTRFQSCLRRRCTVVRPSPSQRGLTPRWHLLALGTSILARTAMIAETRRRIAMDGVHTACRGRQLILYGSLTGCCSAAPRVAEGHECRLSHGTQSTTELRRAECRRLGKRVGMSGDAAGHQSHIPVGGTSITYPRRFGCVADAPEIRLRAVEPLWTREVFRSNGTRWAKIAQRAADSGEHDACHVRAGEWLR